MRSVKVSEATERELDWLVGELEFRHLLDQGSHVKAWVLEDHRKGLITHPYSTSWLLGGPIIEREKIELIPPKDEDDHEWMAVWYKCDDAEAGIQVGTSPLIAAMRCYVASKLGDTVEVPEELCK